MSRAVYITEYFKRGRWLIAKKQRMNDKGKRNVFNARNKKKRAGFKTRVVVAQLDKRGRIIGRRSLREHERLSMIQYPFEGSPKDCPERRRVYDAMTIKFGARHTSGDRARKLTSSGNISDHWEGQHSSWGEDYGWKWWTLAGRRMKAAAERHLRANWDRYKLKQILFITHGTGPHGHIAGHR